MTLERLLDYPPLRAVYYEALAKQYGVVIYKMGMSGRELMLCAAAAHAEGLNLPLVVVARKFMHPHIEKQIADAQLCPPQLLILNPEKFSLDPKLHKQFPINGFVLNMSWDAIPKGSGAKAYRSLQYLMDRAAFRFFSHSNSTDWSPFQSPRYKSTRNGADRLFTMDSGFRPYEKEITRLDLNSSDDGLAVEVRKIPTDTFVANRNAAVRRLRAEAQERIRRYAWRR